ncbi:MAG: DUF6266 family protein [Treponema sp.]|nr:DUF6266 family protein [Treponema sp.]
MATLNFIRGSIKGKVGQFVGSSWRGKDYIKTFTPPSNPRTEGQVAVRTIFQNVAHIAKAIYEAVLKPFTFPRPHRITAYNRMVQINKALFEAMAWDPAKLRIFEGPLFNPGIASASISGASVSVSFDAATGEGTDAALAVVYDEITGQTMSAQGVRADAVVTVPIATFDQADLSGLYAYLVFSQEPAQGTNDPGQVSNTAYFKVPAA